MTVVPAWSHPVRLAELNRAPLRKRLAPDAATRARIATELALDGLDDLRADVTLTPWLDGAVLEARWTAVVEQTCGITLEPFSTRLEGDYSVRVLPHGSKNAPEEPGGEVMVDPLADDPPDVLEGDSVDLAAYVVEHLALEIDPFPRKPGAEFTPPDEPDPPSPFEALRNFTPRPKGD